MYKGTQLEGFYKDI